jgi:hypothetical protein
VASIGRLLDEAGRGSEAALAELVPLVYDELRRIARGYLRRERADHTLQTTALVPPVVTARVAAAVTSAPGSACGTISPRAAAQMMASVVVVLTLSGREVPSTA